MGCCRLSQIENSNEYPSAAAASVGASALQRCPPDTRTPYTGEARVCAIPKLCR